MCLIQQQSIYLNGIPYYTTLEDVTEDELPKPKEELPSGTPMRKDKQVVEQII
jgi:hypothetical protein